MVWKRSEIRVSQAILKSLFIGLIYPRFGLNEYSLVSICSLDANRVIFFRCRIKPIGANIKKIRLIGSKILLFESKFDNFSQNLRLIGSVNLIYHTCSAV